MHIAIIVLTIFKQVYDFPLMLSHEMIEQIDVDLESTEEYNLHR